MMRSSLAFLAWATLGAVSSFAWAEDARPSQDLPPSQPPEGGPRPTTSPPSQPPSGTPPSAAEPLSRPWCPCPLPPAQQVGRSANNTIYADLLGPGLYYSIDYDRTFGDFAARVGFSYFSLVSASVLTVPLTMSYLGIGSKKHIFEIGAGMTIVSVGTTSTTGISIFTELAGSRSSTKFAAPTGILGYRMQPADGGFFLHGGFAPQIFIGGRVEESRPGWRKIMFWPAPYIGLGATF